MKKLFISVLGILFFSAQHSVAQVSFSHAIGAGIYAASDSTGGASGSGIVYSPRLNLLNFNDNATLSLGTHLAFGIDLNSQEGASNFVFDFPIMAELNVGHACNTDNTNAAGFYVGAGYGFNSEGLGMNTGLVLNGGFRTNVLFQRSLELRFALMIPFNTTSTGTTSVIGLNLSYTFGMNN